MFDISMVKVLPMKPRVPFIKMRIIAGIISIVAVLASLFLFFTEGLNYGIDFKGGSVVQFTVDEMPDLEAIRKAGNALDIGSVQVQTISLSDGDKSGVRFSYPLQDPKEPFEGSESEIALKDAALQQETLTRVQTMLETEFGIPRVKIDDEGVEQVNMSASVIGSKVSGELRTKGMIAVVASLAMVLLYIWIRFEWQFALGAVMALAHDVALTLGVFELFQIEFNLAIVAAILTIVGYSLNDTVIVYDRIRENLRKYKKMLLPDVLNLSINDTLSRTIMTSVTTLLALLSLYILGGEGLRGFSFAMIWGVFVGTYSSIFVASPLLLLLGVKRPSGEPTKETAVTA